MYGGGWGCILGGEKKAGPALEFRTGPTKSLQASKGAAVSSLYSRPLASKSMYDVAVSPSESDAVALLDEPHQDRQEPPAALTPERQALAERWIPLVYSILRTFAREMPPMQYRRIGDDLLSAGLLGLISAAQFYDEGMGYQFSTYATRAIRRRIDRELFLHQRRAWMERTGVGQVGDHGERIPVVESAPDTRGHSPSRQVADALTADDVLGRLTPRRRAILHMYHCEGRSHGEIARILGVTEGCVSGIHRAAMRTLGSDWEPPRGGVTRHSDKWRARLVVGKHGTQHVGLYQDARDARRAVRIACRELRKGESVTSAVATARAATGLGPVASPLHPVRPFQQITARGDQWEAKVKVRHKAKPTRSLGLFNTERQARAVAELVQEGIDQGRPYASVRAEVLAACGRSPVRRRS